MALFLEESLYRGTQCVVFEHNDEQLWAQVRLNLAAFMNGLFRQGAFQGKTPAEAYFVKCDNETTTQTDRDLGRVNILAAFAPLKPAELVSIKIQQMAGQIQTCKATMAQFTVNTNRFDPYKDFKLRVKWDGRYIAGVRKVGGLKHTTEVVKHREGGPTAAAVVPPLNLDTSLKYDRGLQQKATWAGNHALWRPRAGACLNRGMRHSLDLICFSREFTYHGRHCSGRS